MGQIQRIQSIYLLIAAVAGSALFGFPFATAPAQQEGMLVDGAFDINDHIGLIVLTVLVIFLSVVTIFLYNNRVLQMNLGKLNIVLLLGLVGLAGYLFFTLQVATSLGVGLVAPALVLIFVVLANRNIQKDEKLVRSADRLR
ncbi:MAG: DUF4293 domain-containing protein [Aureispira sp.]